MGTANPFRRPGESYQQTGRRFEKPVDILEDAGRRTARRGLICKHCGSSAFIRTPTKVERDLEKVKVNCRGCGRWHSGYWRKVADPVVKLEIPEKQERTSEWAAGLFEGEGTIAIDIREEKYFYTRVAISMTDEEEIREFARIVGVGNVTTHASKEGYKQMWYWQVSRVSELKVFIEKIVPWLGERRRAKLFACLDKDTRFVA